MAAKSSKVKPESQETGTDEMSMPAEKSGPVEGSEGAAEELTEEPTESPDTEGDGDTLVSEEAKTLIAMRPILYLAKQYKAGDCLPVNDHEMVSAWIEAGSAAWQKPDRRRFP